MNIENRPSQIRQNRGPFSEENSKGWEATMPAVRVSRWHDDHRWEATGSVVLHWVVQRNAQTDTLITFKSFADYPDAERHKAELEAIADPLGFTSVVAIESLPIAQFPNSSARASALSCNSLTFKSIAIAPAP